MSVTYETFKSIFDDELKDLKIDTDLLKRIRHYGQAFVNKNKDHIEFFGTNLFGTAVIRFRNSDYNDWYDGVIYIDEVATRARFTNILGVNSEWVRVNDVMNMSCLYLCHRIYNASNLTKAERIQGMIDTMLALQYKLISSIMFHYVQYPVNKDTAQAVYATFSKKFHIKQNGSWGQMLLERAKDIVSDNGIHVKKHMTIPLFDDTDKINAMITDIQGRLRSIVKNIWAVLRVVLDQDTKIYNNRMLMTVKGDVLIRDLERHNNQYRRYIHSVVSDHSQFIRPELCSVIYDAMHTMEPRLLDQTLQYISNEYQRDPNDDIIERYIDETILHLIDFLTTDKSEGIRSSDLGAILAKVRSNYMASRSSDPMLINMRDWSEKIVKRALKIKTPSQIAAVRTGVALYIVLRTLLMHHYS